MIKYYIPIIGVILLWGDIPHEPHEYAYKPVQGDKAFSVIFFSWMSTLAFILLMAWLFLW